MDRIVKELVWDKTDGKCWYCGVTLDEDHRKLNGFTTDHIEAKCNGGEHRLENLVPCCRQCNSGKSGMNLENYRLSKTLKKFVNVYGVTFSRRQLTFLKDEHNVDILNDFGHLFWFETEGLKI